MKKICAIVVMALLMLIPSLSAEAIEVNGNEAQLGQTITYEIHASGCSALIQAVDIEVTYDETALEYVKDSIQMPNLTGTLVNDGEKNSIKFNALDLNGFSFGTDDLVASMKFRIISDHAPYLYIKSDVRNFIDDSLVDHKDEYIYYLTLTEDEIKQIETASEEIIEKSSDNNSAANSDSTRSTVSSSQASDISAVKSVLTQTDQTDDEKQNEVTSVHTADSPYGNNPHDDTVTAVASKPTNYSVIFFAAAGMLALIAIIAVVLLIAAKKSDNTDLSDK